MLRSMNIISLSSVVAVSPSVWNFSHEQETQSSILTNSRHSLDSTGEQHVLTGTCWIIFPSINRLKRIESTQSLCVWMGRELLISPFSVDQFDSRSIEDESVHFQLSFDQGAPSSWSVVTLAFLYARLKTSCLNHNNRLRRWSFSDRTSRYAWYSKTQRIICSHDDDRLQSCENLVWFHDFYSSPAWGWWRTSIWVTNTVSEH